jgi:hypothetical protein
MPFHCAVQCSTRASFGAVVISDLSTTRKAFRTMKSPHDCSLSQSDTDSVRDWFMANFLDTIIEFLDIIHRPAFYLKHNVSETGFCLRLQVKAYSVGPNR